MPDPCMNCDINMRPSDAILRAVIRYIIIAVLLVHLVVATGCMMVNPKEQRAKNEPRLAAEGMIALSAGAPAPPLDTVAHNGTKLSVPDGLDGKRLLLFFYPADNTPNTTRELLSLSKWAAELAIGNINVYGISQGTVADHGAFAKQYGILLPLLADPDASISVAYGCAPTGGEYLQRTLVGITPDGTIAFFERGFDVTNSKTIIEWFDNGAAEAVPATPTTEEAPASEEQPAQDETASADDE